MFVSLFYRFRSNGLKVSLEEWLTLMNGLQQGLHDCSLHGFYTLCRAVVVSSETDFDRFDQVFFEFFRGIEPQERLPEAMLQWLEHPELTRSDWKLLGKFTNMQVEEIETLADASGSGQRGIRPLATRERRCSEFGSQEILVIILPIGLPESGDIGTGAQTVPWTLDSFKWHSAVCASCPRKRMHQKRNWT